MTSVIVEILIVAFILWRCYRVEFKLHQQTVILETAYNILNKKYDKLEQEIGELRTMLSTYDNNIVMNDANEEDVEDYSNGMKDLIVDMFDNEFVKDIADNTLRDAYDVLKHARENGTLDNPYIQELENCINELEQRVKDETHEK